MKTNSHGIQNYIDHLTKIDSENSIRKAKRLLASSPTGYGAVTRGSLVIGLTSIQKIEAQEASAFNKPKAVEDCLIAAPIICTSALPIEDNLNYAIKQSSSSTHDIVIIDDDMSFVGLVCFRTLLRIQKDYYSDQLAESTRSQYIQKEKVAHLSSTKSEYKRKIEQLIQSREDFIMRFGHEAKTPMTSIQGVLELIAETKLKGEQSQMVQSANACAKTLLRLIDSTIEYAHLEADKLELTETTYSPAEIIQTCIHRTATEAAEKGLAIELQSAVIPDYVIGDQKYFARAIENIIAKAIDHTQSGGIRISARKITRKKIHSLIIEITATGTNWNSLNSLNTELNPDRYDIGLIVSTGIIAKLKGSFTYEESEADGSCYRVEIPVKILSPKSAQQAHKDEQIKRLVEQATKSQREPQLRVLIIDDNKVNLDVAKRFLQLLSCEVHLAMSGSEGLQKLQETQFDCVFMDCRMPELTGYETTRLIRSGKAGDQNSSIFISAMTAQTSDHAREECYRSGMNFYVPKPVNKRSFEKALAACSKHNEQPIEMYAEASETKKEA